MRRKWKIAPSLTGTGALVLAGTAAADDTLVTARGPRTAAPPTPNQVILWNRILHSILRTADAPHPTAHPTRVLAMMHLAIADAVSAISRRFEPYGAKLPVAPNASHTAAAAQAAHDVLVALYPSLTPSLDANLAAALHTVRDGLNRDQRHRRRGRGGAGDPDAAMEGPPLSDIVAVRPPRPPISSGPARPAVGGEARDPRTNPRRGGDRAVLERPDPRLLE